MKSNLKLGSLFDGSGGFPLGGLLSGIIPVWAAEIEPFPIRVTTKRLPLMKHLGDVSKISGDKIEPVDIITFGSPCTDMSVAGKRAGLNGQQSCLFYEAIRIVKEMRSKTNGKYPRYIVWENVPGAFSSNKGKDFKAVLDAIISIVEQDAEVPMPEKDKWAYADSIVGDRWSIAYRTLDAQYWGVPQRRKRIYLVADFASKGAWKILFKSEGLSGYSPQSFSSWQRITRDITNSIGASSLCLNDQGGSRMDVTNDITATLRAEARHPPCVIDSVGFCTEHSAKSRGIGYEPEKSPTLRAGVVPAAVSIENHSADSRIQYSEDNKVQTLTSRMGTGGNNVPLIMSNHSSDRSCVCIQGSLIGRADKNGPNGIGVSEETAYTLNTVDRHAVYAMTTGNFMQVVKDKSPTIAARDYKDPNSVAYGIDRAMFNQGKNALFEPSIKEELAQTLVAKGPGATFVDYSVRRLTPTECARLQGFPDWWCRGLETENPTDEEIAFWRHIFETHRKIVGKSTKPKTDKQIIKWLKNPHSDSAEYKMWGNGVALPNVVFVLSGIVWYTQLNQDNF